MTAVLQHDSGNGGGSGKARTPEPRFLAVGQVSRPHGVRGELRVQILTDYPERLGQHEGAEVKAAVNILPSLASLSIKGVRASLFP